MWGQGVFERGGYTLDSLIAEAHKCDFAVLVATPDDIRVAACSPLSAA
ncbi:TIR domain-containing protein [Brachybacterium equifaecis]